MEMNDDTWHLVKQTTRVLGFIGGTTDKPAPITDKEADAILQRVRDGADKPTHKTIYEPGEVVRVTEGPLPTLTAWLKASITANLACMWRLEFWSC